MNPTHADIIKQQVERFVEEGAALEHTRWARWQAWVFARARKNPDGSRTISAEDVKRWERQIDTDYEKLSEPEKESDREQVREYIPLLTTAMHAAAQATEKAGDVEEKTIATNTLRDLTLALKPHLTDREKLESRVRDDKLFCLHYEAAVHNAAIAQSRRQLDAHFGRKGV